MRLLRGTRRGRVQEAGAAARNLNTLEPAYACDYHVYEVAKPFFVWQGPIAPRFEQPGGGRQIKLDQVFLNAGEGQRLNVKWLLEHDCLEPA
ncbi:TNT domain-containing protein [Streptomyces sp. NPDC048641]|uniref:TNT domain-containing protein n=1 Tax=Streptomyces sp. NPDC048641 TaxID=3154825 RepID=UPI003443DE2C